jgi:hypothetical protein
MNRADIKAELASKGLDLPTREQIWQMLNDDLASLVDICKGYDEEDPITAMSFLAKSFEEKLRDDPGGAARLAYMASLAIQRLAHCVTDQLPLKGG